MNVHPSAVVDPPGPTTAEPFAPEALYEYRQKGTVSRGEKAGKVF
jgi:hypothetical protein